MKICVGLTGPNASGKGEVSLILGEAGFSRHSLSDVVREEATRQGLDHSRESLIRTGTWLREKFGPGILAERILPILGDRSVVDSIRNPGEIQVLRRLPGFRLIGVDAPIELRFERSRLRARAGDGETLEDFQKKESLELAGEGPGQQLRVCLSMADEVILNDGTLQELRHRVRQVLTPLGVDPA
jgi:dephospho-CoA kinase